MNNVYGRGGRIGMLAGVLVALACGGESRSTPESGAAPAAAGEPGVNQLTAAEQQEGWRLLFDGMTLDGWRGFGRDDVPAGWQVDDDGTLAFHPEAGDGGDLITDDSFDNFELQAEWKISPGGNSGIFYHVSESVDYTYESGPEMQVLDNAGHADGKNPLTSAGSNYALNAPSADVTRPVGSWNAVRIVVQDSLVQHWMNGTKVVEYHLWSDEWKRLVAASKFAEMPEYGLSLDGHIALQDHGAPVWFRNIKIRPLD
jgi:3-keto-disaccharide hydrolase